MELIDFVRESNRIEGIHRRPTAGEVAAHREFLADKVLDVGVLAHFVNLIQPGAFIRDSAGMDVRVGDHAPRPGGSDIPIALEQIIKKVNLSPSINYQSVHAHRIHKMYEDLHPFMDGNGRSGRVLWLRMMGGIDHAPLGFLHHWYYQSLQS